MKDIIDSERSWMYEIIDNDIALMNSEGTIVYRIPYDEFMIDVEYLKKENDENIVRKTRFGRSKFTSSRETN